MNTSQCFVPLLLGLSVAGCSPAVPGEVEAAAADAGAYVFPVTFVEIQGGTVEEMSEFSGDVASKRHGILAFERAGRIVEMLAEEGDRVEAGQLLARLDDSVLEAELMAARAIEVAARAQREYAELELERFEGMADAAADTDRDQWRFEIAIRSATEIQRAAEIRRLEHRLAQGELHAPFTGVLVRRSLTLGSYATPGASVFEIVDLEHREIRIELPQSMMALLVPGIAVEIHAEALPGGMLESTLDAILPSAQSSARTFTGLVPLGLDLDPELRLLPGSYVLARLRTRMATTDTVVPSDSLLASDHGWEVVVAEGDDPPSARFVSVRVLATDGRRVAVVPSVEGGLHRGARVVVTGTDNIFPHAPLLLHPHRNPSAIDRDYPIDSDS